MSSYKVSPFQRVSALLSAGLHSTGPLPNSLTHCPASTGGLLVISQGKGKKANILDLNKSHHTHSHTHTHTA